MCPSPSQRHLSLVVAQRRSGQGLFRKANADGEGFACLGPETLLFQAGYLSIMESGDAETLRAVVPEDVTNRGRIDLTIKTQTGIWILEFKVKGPMVQLRERG